MQTAVRPRLFTVDEYYAMGKAGVFAPDERVELLEGRIITMAPIGPPHGGAVNSTQRGDVYRHLASKVRPAHRSERSRAGMAGGGVDR